MPDVIHTDGADPDFIDLCRQLDLNLDEIVGGRIQREQYAPFNKLDDIHDAVVIYADGTPAAGGGLRRIDESTAEIKRIFVRPEFRGRGYSKILMRELEARALQLGCSRLILETGRILTASVGLYRRVGFTEIENYGPYKEIEESLCMGKVIAGRSSERTDRS